MATLTDHEVKAALRTLIENGLNFGQCVAAFGATEGDELAYAEWARRYLARDGHTEIDPVTVVSLSDDVGAYVMAWRWVDESDVWDGGPVDSDGKPARFINKYHCDDCDESWESQWSCACDDECGGCGKSYTPEETVELDLAGEPIKGEA